MTEMEIERIDVNEKGQKLLWCPFGIMSKTKMRTRGTFPKNYPRGLVVHFSAGRSMRGDKDSENCIAYGETKGYAYWCLSRTGNIFMSHPLDSYGWHAGTSEWKGHKGVSQYCLGLEINNAGRVTPKGDVFESWFHEEYPVSEVRYSKAKENIQAGYYHKYTQEQEKALVHLCLWLKSNNPDVFDFDWVVGHDEIAMPLGRKNDPGASLSVTMPEFRNYLKQQYELIK